jgi:hypothetical protein
MKANIFVQLHNIFISKKWIDKDEDSTVFERFCQLFSKLEVDQQELLLELTERYIWLSFNEYNGKLFQVLNRISDEELKGVKKIYLFPIMNPKDENKTKSGHGVLLAIRGLRPNLKKYDNIKFVEIEQYGFFQNPDFEIRDDERIFLLDDFLGSGETLRASIDALISSSKKISIANIRIISIVTHIQSKEYMEKLGAKFYTEIITTKGISDHYVTPVLEEKVAIMEEIEKLIPSKKFNFGYGKSEALITLYRTPNNTFPIFWHSYIINGEKFRAPFSRH